MAVVTRDRGRRSRVFGFGRFAGLGDAASDAILASSWGAADYAAWQTAVAKLPAGYTMGDPTSPLWGAAYFNGVKLDSEPNDPAVSAAIHAAADAAYALYGPINGIRSSTNPAMVAVLLDPEWIALQGSGQPIVWANLSAELQDKIKQVPNLYNALIGNLAAVTPPLITSGPTVAPTGPARYLQGGVEFLEDGTVISYNGSPVTGVRLTSGELHSLLTTGQLPAGDTTFVPPARPAPTSTSQSPADVPATTTPPEPGGGGSPSNVTVANDNPSGGGVPSFASPPSTPAPAATPAASSGLGKWWLVAAGVAAVAFTVTHSRPSRRSRRRRRRS